MTRSLVLAAAVLIVLPAACDLVVYNEDAVSSARVAGDMEEIASFRLDGWFYDQWSDNEGNLPSAFLPFRASASDGYLITRYDNRLDIATIFDGRERGGFSVNVPDNGGWDAWVVPRDPEKPQTLPVGAFDGYGAFRPLLIATNGQDGPRLYLYDVDLLDIERGSLDLIDMSGFVDDTVGALFDGTPGAFTIPFTFVAVNAVHLQGPPTGDFPDFPWDSLLVEILARPVTTGQIEEYLALVDADEIRDVVAGTFVRGSTLAAPGNARFPLPPGAAESAPRDLRYAFIPESGYGVLSYRDEAGSPAAIWWDTFAASSIPEELSSAIVAGPVTQDGIVLSSRTGRVETIDSDGARSHRDFGALWFVGQYLYNGELRDIFSYVGATSSGGDAELFVSTFVD